MNSGCCFRRREGRLLVILYAPTRRLVGPAPSAPVDRRPDSRQDSGDTLGASAVHCPAPVHITNASGRTDPRVGSALPRATRHVCTQRSVYCPVHGVSRSGVAPPRPAIARANAPKADNKYSALPVAKAVGCDELGQPRLGLLVMASSACGQRGQ